MSERKILRQGLFASKPGGGGKKVVFQGLLKDAVQSYKEGKEQVYNMVIGQICDRTAKSSQMLEWFQEGREIASMLGKPYHKLVEALLQVRWMEREKAVLISFKSFVISLIDTNPVHLRMVLRLLSKCLIPVDAQADKRFEVRTSDEKVYEAVHSIFKEILRLIPASNILLKTVLESSFPFIKKPIHVMKPYVENLLTVTTYYPSLRPGILTIIVQKMADMDVHSPREKFDEDDDEDEESDDDNEDADEKKDEMMEDSDNMKYELGNTLDILMCILFEYIHRTCHNSEGKLDGKESYKLFRELMDIFHLCILPLHAVSHVQFILFYICSFNKGFSVRFLDFLWKQTLDSLLPHYTRQSCACYMASFLARSNYLPLTVVLKYLKQMSNWTNKYIQDNMMTSYTLECNVVKHRTFYNICQAIFYIVVFRHEQILQHAPGHKFLRELDLQQLVMSNLNPLKACLPTVVTMFSMLMRSHQLVYCETIIKRNNRLMLPIVGMSNTSQLGSQNPLECFFPFDPYLLKRSSRFVEPHFQEWKGPQITRTESKENEENDEEIIMETAPMDISMSEFIHPEDNDDDKIEDMLSMSSIFEHC